MRTPSTDPSPRGLLALRAPEGARRLLRGQLKCARGAAARARAERAGAALHEFRVSVRRLRALLKDHAPALPDVSAADSVRAALRQASRLTGPARDAQAWGPLLRRLAPGPLPPRLREALAARRDGARERALERFSSAASALERLLGGRARAGGAPLGMAAAGRLKRRRRRLLERLRRVRRSGGPEALHRARLAVKRVRYLLEPLAPALAGSETAIAELKGLQDRLGDLRDLQNLEAFLATVPGTRSLRGAAAARRAQAEAAARRACRGERVGALGARLKRLGGRLGEKTGSGARTRT